MKELQRIRQLIEDHYNGNPWLDVTITHTLSRISAGQAAAKTGDHNSIWQIVNHMIAWRLANLERMQGKKSPAPENNFIEPVSDTSAKAWQQTLQKFETSQKQLLQFLDSADGDWFDNIYIPNGHSYYEHLQGILQHDAYHLGQIVLLAKLVK